MALTWVNSLGRSLLWAGRVRISLVPSPSWNQSWCEIGCCCAGSVATDMRPGMAHALGVCVQCRTRVRAKVAIEHLLEGGLCRPPRRRRGVRVASDGAAAGGLEV
jgi:hypothetical protein